MELDEVLHRILRRYGLLLAAGVAIPAIMAVWIMTRMPASYLSSARVQLAAKTPDSAAAADAMVSQARALVTSTTVVERAIREAATSRDMDDLITNQITVDGLGTSSTISVSVSDRDPTVARRLVTSLVGQLVNVTNQLRLGNLPSGLKAIDDQLAALAAKRAPIAAEAQADPRDAVAQNRLAGMDRLITDLSTSRNDLTLQSAMAGQASVIDPPLQPAEPEPSRVVQITLLVGLAALVVVLLLIAVVETLRPHVSGLARISRLLDAPSLGRVLADRRTRGLRAGLLQRLRLAARRAGCTTIVVVPTGRVAHLDDVVDRLDQQLATSVGHPQPVDQDGAQPVRAPGSVGDPAPVGGPEASAGPEPAGDLARAASISVGDVLLVTDRTPATTATAGNGSAAWLRPASVAGIRLVTTLDRLGPAQEGSAVGVLMVTPKVTRRAGIDEVRQLLEISGWPLLGVASLSSTGRPRPLWLSQLPPSQLRPTRLRLSRLRPSRLRLPWRR